jgi:hypothetical protein
MSFGIDGVEVEGEKRREPGGLVSKKFGIPGYLV